MELDELNRRLFALSDSERAYRDGAAYDWTRGNDVTVADGRTVLRMGDTTLGFQEAYRTRLHSENEPPLTGSFFVRRNSRFNPVPEHVHTYMEMSYVYAGTCPQLVNQKHLTLKENQVLLLDANCPHAIGMLGENDIMLSVVVSKEYLRQLLDQSVGQSSIVGSFLLGILNEQTDHNRYVRFHSQDNRRIRRLFQELVCEYLDPSPNAEVIIMHLLQVILAELVNVYESDVTRRGREGASSRVQVIPIIRYIERNFSVCTQESVAEHFYISPNYVSTLLKRHTGMTYRQMVQAQKLGRAASLLRTTDLPIAEVAHESGYENQSFFYRKFRERYGCLPAAYREQHRRRIGA